MSGVQRCQRHERLQLVHQLRGDELGPRVPSSAMYDAVAERRQPPLSELRPSPGEQRRQQVSRNRRLRPPVRRSDGPAVGALSLGGHANADPVYLP
jgi:hypothetical protein